MLINGESQRLLDDEQIPAGNIQREVSGFQQLEGGFQDYSPTCGQVKSWILASMKDLGIKV